MSQDSQTIPQLVQVVSDVQRPHSIRSVASNSSIASGVSLTRRARTRTRAKTLTGVTSSRFDGTPALSNTTDLPYFDKGIVQEPGMITSPESMPVMPAPHRPARSPNRPESAALSGGDLDQPVRGGDIPLSEETVMLDAADVKISKAAKQALNLAEISTTTQSSQALPRLDTSDHLRDSVYSHSSNVSITSSSVYPQSSTASGPDSPPSPRSLVGQEYHHVTSVDPDIDGYDGDDVSYRLRLLVKNNYFLPPAHSKPSPSDFASSVPKKPTTTGFLDYFRVGKSKSKPASPNTPHYSDTLAPVLRTTADSITASGYAAPRSRSRSTPQSPSLPPHTPQDRSGRVVVVREKMDDLIVAAKQVEQDLRTRGFRHDQGSQRAKRDSFDSVIDPTDLVDLPPPSSSYPFAVQASALHGLGVQDSVGAAQLAERLPPPNSSGTSFLDLEGDSWRKALLQEAVHHSLHSSADMSFRSPGPSSPISLSSPIPLTPSVSHLALSNTKPLLEQPIISHYIELDDGPAFPSKTTRSKSRNARGRSRLPAPDHHDTSRPSSLLHLRAETPAAPHTPLAPPPRKQMFNPLYSLSQTDLAGEKEREHRGRTSTSSGGRPPKVSRVIRKTASSPMLSDSYESEVTDSMPLTFNVPSMSISPSPGPSSGSRGISSSIDRSRERESAFATPASRSSAEERDERGQDEDPRPSTAYSLLTDGRPSFSDYSQPSPTVSAFRDALSSNGYHSTSSSFQSPLRQSIDNHSPSFPTNLASRASTTSPPPRVSSSMANIALPPPPRKSSLYYTPMESRVSISSCGSVRNESPSGPSRPGPSQERDYSQILAPEPVTPPFPLSERRGNPNPSFSLTIPTVDIPVLIHSAPPPSSPTSFFDSIQTHPNAMDDLDSSSDESEGEDDHDVEDDDDDDYIRRESVDSLLEDSRTRTMSSATEVPAVVARENILRLGNHSTPHVGCSTEAQSSSPYDALDPRKPISNIPLRAPFFSDKLSAKSERGISPIASPFDFHSRQYEDEHSGSHSPKQRRRPATAGARTGESNQSEKESLRKLDGMLIQHMETERDIIKRIATDARAARRKPEY